MSRHTNYHKAQRRERHATGGSVPRRRITTQSERTKESQATTRSARAKWVRAKANTSPQKETSESERWKEARAVGAGLGKRWRRSATNWDGAGVAKCAETISSGIPLKVSRLFAFGYEALVGHTVVSLRANARLTHYTWFTGKSKAWRLTTNKNLVAVFHTLFARICAVVSSDIVAIDFSDFKDNRQVLMFAQQTREGRAFPLFFDVLEYPVKEGSQNLFVVATIKRFLELTRCTPTLVFDRGFAIPYLIKFLAQNNIPFIIRIKRRKFVTVAKGKKRGAVEELGLTDAIIEEWGVRLRLVCSDKPEEEGEPWYLVTNDMKSTRTTIIERYYHRFEIEEFFRDTKRLLGLEHHQMKSVRSLSILLWFVILGTWFFHFCIDVLSDEQRREQKLWRVSLVRYVWELLRREAWREREPAPPALSAQLKTV